jgi:putative restriction endonuclease
MEFVQRVADASGGEVTREQLQQFTFGDERIKLLDTGRGIRNPRQLSATLTVMTSLSSRYDDTPGPEGFLRYAIRDGDIGQGDNRKLQAAYELALPLIWFHAVRDGVFVPVMPVYLVEELPASKQYAVALGEDQRLMAPALLAAPESAIEQTMARLYVERLTRQRLHQPAFRARVMYAYQTSCAVCALRRGNLLDAAHIVEDGAPKGDPITPNGLALCKIHHAAYDQDIIGIRPDHVVQINDGVLLEVDGPMLKHGLQEFHGQPLRVVPRRPAERPDPERLAIRFERFLHAS